MMEMPYNGHAIGFFSVGLHQMGQTQRLMSAGSPLEISKCGINSTLTLNVLVFENTVY